MRLLGIPLKTCNRFLLVANMGRPYKIGRCGLRSKLDPTMCFSGLMQKEKLLRVLLKKGFYICPGMVPLHMHSISIRYFQLMTRLKIKLEAPNKQFLSDQSISALGDHSNDEHLLNDLFRNLCICNRSACPDHGG